MIGINQEKPEPEIICYKARRDKGFYYLRASFLIILLFAKQPGALHPIVNAMIKALTCFCLFGLWPKRQAIPLIERDGR
jgi:hypothetical protein